MDHDSDVTSSLAPPTPSADSPTATEAETANQTADTSAASHGGGSFSSESETSKLTTANKPSTEAQTSFLSDSPEATGEPSHVTSAPRSSAQSDGATPPEEEEEEEDEGRDEDHDQEELGNTNNFHLQNENVL